ncbi:MAG: ATP12 family protein [Paracoccaceae bacterium]
MIIGREKYWKKVKKEKQTDNLFLIYLDKICLKSDQGNNIKLSTQLADEVVREWNTDGKIDAIKNSFYTKLCFSVADMTKKERKNVLGRLVEYGNCDPICYIADQPIKLHLTQKNLYSPLIDWAEKFLSIKLNKGAGLRFIEQPPLNSGKIKKYLDGLDNFHLATINEITKSLGSLFTCLALYNNALSKELAWKVANVEDNFRIEVWGEVEEETLIKRVNYDHFNNLVKILKMI